MKKIIKINFICLLVLVICSLSFISYSTEEENFNEENQDVQEEQIGENNEEEQEEPREETE